MGKRYNYKADDRFLNDLNYIKDNKLVHPNDWELFKAQVEEEFKKLDENWEEISRKTEYPPLSNYGYRKRYIHSIPLRLKEKRGWQDKRSDFRIVFKVDEVKKEIYYLAIGKRIKGFPKDPNDIWSILKNRVLPEEECPKNSSDKND